MDREFLALGLVAIRKQYADRSIHRRYHERWIRRQRIGDVKDGSHEISPSIQGNGLMQAPVGFEGGTTVPKAESCPLLQLLTVPTPPGGL